MLDTGHYWESPYIEWVKDIPEEWVLLVFYIRDSRNKAIVPAVLEALALLHSYEPMASLSGPLADQKGVFWIGIEASYLEQCVPLFQRLGYSYAVDQVVPLQGDQDLNADTLTDEGQDIARWRGDYYKLQKLYQEDADYIRNRAPDKRSFLLEDSGGNIRTVKGYRGDSGALSRRGLPVEDARLLVNLTNPSITSDIDYFLDPFAGVGGIVIEAIDSNFTVFSLDIDPKLRHGLQQFGASHIVGNAMNLPFKNASISAIATEPPYHEKVSQVVVGAFAEMYRTLKRNGRLAILASPWEADLLLEEATRYPMELIVASPINRKGTQVVILVWKKLVFCHV